MESFMATPCGSAVAPTPQKTALVVASSGAVDEILTSVLTSEGWSIQHAGDNQPALSRATSEACDLMVTGRKTLDREDVELFRRIRSSRPHVRLIILTDQWTSGDVISAMR